MFDSEETKMNKTKMNMLKRTPKVQKRVLLLDGALKELVVLNIAVIADNKYVYSTQFEQTCKTIIASPLSRLKQMSLGTAAGKILMPQILALATTKPSRRDIDNLITAYVCVRVYIDECKCKVDKKLVPDLAYAAWYLNDHAPTLEEVEEMKSKEIKE